MKSTTLILTHSSHLTCYPQTLAWARLSPKVAIVVVNLSETRFTVRTNLQRRKGLKNRRPSISYVRVAPSIQNLPDFENLLGRSCRPLSPIKSTKPSLLHTQNVHYFIMPKPRH